MILEAVQKTALLLTLIKGGKTYKKIFTFFLLLGVKINMGNCLSVNIFFHFLCGVPYSAHPLITNINMMRIEYVGRNRETELT